MPLSVQLLNVKTTEHSWVYSLDSDECIIKWLAPNEEFKDVFVIHYSPFNFECMKEIAKATFKVMCHHKSLSP